MVLLVVPDGKKDTETPLINIVKGVTLQKVFSTITYETTVPLNFVLELPIVKHQGNYTYQCRAADYLCSMMENSKKIGQVFFDEVISSHPYLNTGQTERTTRGLFNFVGEWQKVLYGLGKSITDLF